MEALILVLALAGAAVEPTHAPRTSPPDAKAMVATANGFSISTEEVDAAAAGELAQLRARESAVRMRALNRLIDDRLLREEAARRGIPVLQLLGGASLGETSPGSKTKSGSGEWQRAEVLRALRRRAGVRVLLEVPRVTMEPATGPALGPAEAPVTIVEFSDFQCPYCARAENAIREIVDRYAGEVRLVHRDFPLPSHPFAGKAAEAAQCAGRQGRFWEMRRLLFAHPAELQPERLRAYAAELGLAAAEFAQCLDSGELEPTWKASLEEGRRYGVTGTPAFLVNGRLLAGAPPLAEFISVIDDELERARGDAGSRRAAP